MTLRDEGRPYDARVFFRMRMRVALGVPGYDSAAEACGAGGRLRVW